MHYSLRKHFFISTSVQTTLNLNFLQILVFQKSHKPLKLIFRSAELREILKFDIFQKSLFCTFGKSKVSTKSCSKCSRTLFLNSAHFKEVTTKKKLWKNHAHILQTSCRLFHVLAQFCFTASGSKLGYYQLNVNIRVTE